MTAAARITQADIDRATASAVKAAKRAGADTARIIMDLEARRIEIIIGGPVPDSAGDLSEWSDDDI